MTEGLDHIVFNGEIFYGRTVRVPNEDSWALPNEKGYEDLTMYEEALADTLFKNDEPVSKEAEQIDEEIFCYVPLDILKQNDRTVIDWCKEHDIDI